MDHDQVRDLAIRAGASEKMARDFVEIGRQILVKKEQEKAGRSS